MLGIFYTITPSDVTRTLIFVVSLGLLCYADNEVPVIGHKDWSKDHVKT